jgi:tRNA A-37 threonylcarbamoyl transferase component Bud32
MTADPRSDLLFGKIALNWRLITRDLLNRALHYQQTQEPHKQLGEILLEKGILTREQVNEILSYQQRIQQIKSSQSAFPAPPLNPQDYAHFGGPPQPMTTFGPAPGAAYGQPPHPHSQQGHMSQQQTQIGGMQGSSFGQQNPYSAPTTHLPPGSMQNMMSGQGQGPAPAYPAGPAPAYGGTEGTPPPDQDPLVGAMVGGCKISAKIGAGGMGAIYLAYHEALRKDVVVKILPPESAANPRTVERFFREARAAAKLEHPNVVSVQDVGTTDKGLNYIIMQYVDGQNLEEKIQAEGRHTPNDAAKIVLQVASGLKAAHATGVIHRDIKAENILITTGGVVKVTDFGLAKDLNSELKLTADGAMIGTPLYMAPEIGRVKEIDGRVDIYSLGVTFYYLLTGVQPFRGFTALDILSAKAHDKLKPPEEHTPELPDAYRNVVGKCLEKDRDQRYGDMNEFIRDLEALDRGFPIDAGEPSIWPPRGSGGASKSREQRAGASPGNRKLLLVAGLIGIVIVVVALLAFLISLLT